MQPPEAADRRSALVRWRWAHTSTRMLVMLFFGAVAAAITGAAGAWRYAPLVGWDAAALWFSAWAGWAEVRMDAASTRVHALRDDPKRAATELLVIAASVASLVAVGVVLIEAGTSHGGRKGLLAGLAVVSVALSWLLVHTLFTLKYARLYYATGDGVSFNQDEPPRYSDFAYLAFTIGMTFQVSDTNLTNHAVRATALRHGLLSYLFGAVILATTINFIVSLS